MIAGNIGFIAMLTDSGKIVLNYVVEQIGNSVAPLLKQEDISAMIPAAHKCLRIWVLKEKPIILAELHNLNRKSTCIYMHEVGSKL